MLANEPDADLLPPDYLIALCDHRELSPARRFSLFFRGPSPAVSRATRSPSLGRTLPESRLRRLPFGILFKMPTTTTKLSKNKTSRRCDAHMRARQRRPVTVMDRGSPRRPDGHPDRASTHDDHRTSRHRPLYTGGTSRLAGVTSGEAGTDLQANWDRPHLYEKLAEGFATVKRLENKAENRAFCLLIEGITEGVPRSPFPSPRQQPCRFFRANRRIFPGPAA